MDRKVSLIAGFAEACANAVVPQAIADALCERLVLNFPSSAALVFECHHESDSARVVAGANVPGAWSNRSVHIRDVPLLASALEAPDRVHVRPAYGRVSSTDRTLPITAMEALCAAVSESGPNNYILLVLISPSVSTATERREVVDVARRLIAAGISISAGDGDRALTISRIYNAKMEWERAADSVDAILAVLDHRKRVIRASKAVERWVGRPIRDAIGCDLHALLHESCKRENCALRVAIDSAATKLDTHGEESFELYDEKLGRDIRVELRRSSESASGLGSIVEPPRMACIVYDLSAQRAAERELMFLNQSLEERVRTRTQELSEANRALREEIARRREYETSLLRSQRDLAELSNQLVDAQELERKRIAQDLHDSVGQSLTAIKYSLENAQVLLERQRGSEAARLLETGARRVREVLVDVRNISMNLRPAVLDDLGAASAIRYLCREWQETYGSVDLAIDISVEDQQIPESLSTDVFRSVQELLNNVARHAHAGAVQIHVAAADGMLTVRVTDDGAGFDLSGTPGAANAHRESRGLRGLRERTERLGGNYRIETAPGQGTAVSLNWPLAIHQPGSSALN